MREIETGTDHLLVKIENGVGYLIMNRPDARNAMSMEMNEAMQKTIAEFELDNDESLCEGALRNGLKIEHACELSCACTTCHCIVREGFESLEEPTETEEDMLDKAWGLESQSRLSCQIYSGKKDLIVELPKYTVNQVSEEI